MTQKQVEGYFHKMDEFRSVTWDEHRVRCHFDDRFSLEVNLANHRHMCYFEAGVNLLNFLLRSLTLSVTRKLVLRF